jgi:PAS domain S-box-containing protein
VAMESQTPSHDPQARPRVPPFLDAILLALPAALFTLDAAGHVSGGWNPAAERMFGWTAAEVLGRPCPLVPEDGAAEAAALQQRALGGEIHRSVSARGRCKNGATIEVRLSVAPLRDDAGTIVGTLHIVENVTSYLETEKAMRQATQQLQSVIQASPAAIFAMDRAGNVVHCWNPAAERIFGWTAGEALGRQIPIVQEEKFREFHEVRQRVMEGEVIPAFETQRCCKDGSLVDVRIAVAPMLDADGRITGTMGLIEDIAHRKRAERALRDSEARYRAVVEDMAALVCRFRADGTLTFVNDAYCRYFGKTREELVGHDFFRFIPAEDQAKVKSHYSSLTADSPTIACTHRAVRKDGSIRWLRWTDRALLDESGAVTGYQSIGRDVTERRRARRQLAAYQRRLRSLASELVFSKERERRRLSMFLHDQIGQALAMVKMRIESLLAADPPPTRVHQGATEILGQIEQAIQDARSLTFELSPPILYELGFSAALEWLLEDLSKRHGFRYALENDTEPRLLAEDVRVALFLAVRELLVNVVKHAQARFVQVNVDRIEGALRVAVIDDGRGFDTAEVTAPGSHAAGFGLFNILEQLRHLGGEFDIQSAVGLGTTATLVVPVQPESPQEKGTPP